VKHYEHWGIRSFKLRTLDIQVFQHVLKEYLYTFGSVPASDPNSISNSMTSVTDTQLLNPKGIALASGTAALQFEYYY
jgi:hypothetical protein